MLAVSTILTVPLPEGIPFWGILLAATVVAMTQLADRMQQYIDQEEQLFGYEQS